MRSISHIFGTGNLTVRDWTSLKVCCAFAVRFLGENVIFQQLFDKFIRFILDRHSPCSWKASDRDIGCAPVCVRPLFLHIWIQCGEGKNWCLLLIFQLGAVIKETGTTISVDV